jgi:hypothetical protein
MSATTQSANRRISRQGSERSLEVLITIAIVIVVFILVLMALENARKLFL